MNNVLHKLGTYWMCLVLYVFAYKLCVVFFLLQGDYRQLVHELDQYQYCELRLVVLEIRNTYVRHPRPVVFIYRMYLCRKAVNTQLITTILNKSTHTFIKYSSRVAAAETVAKWNPFLLNRRVIKLIAVLVLN